MASQPIAIPAELVELLDDAALDLPTLLTQIQATADPNRPVALVMFGYGEADAAAMTQIVTANGEHGGVYPIADSRQIAGAFATAIGETLEFN